MKVRYLKGKSSLGDMVGDEVGTVTNRGAANGVVVVSVAFEAYGGEAVCVPLSDFEVVEQDEV